MCRLAAYLGPEVPLERIIVQPEHSLLAQSQSANEAKQAVNGDGFGIAWYGEYSEPGQYCEVLPAWSDGNLTSLCRMIQSRCFLAHVRASTGSETSRANCHPFTYGKWSFMHNGRIANFSGIRRQLEAHLSDELYSARRGNTDSELFFLLCLENGLESQPMDAIRASIAQIEALQTGLRHPNRLTVVFSDGETILGLRHSCDGNSPTLYLSGPLHDGYCMVSEPFVSGLQDWQRINEGEIVSVNAAGIRRSALFEPLRSAS